MGQNLFDKYTYLHFAVGVISYFWNISLLHIIVFHSIFELVENTTIGIYFIDHYITFWPGGKLKADSFINSFGDIFGAVLGWISAFYIETLDKKYNLY